LPRGARPPPRLPEALSGLEGFLGRLLLHVSCLFHLEVAVESSGGVSVGGKSLRRGPWGLAWGFERRLPWAFSVGRRRGLTYERPHGFGISRAHYAPRRFARRSPGVGVSWGAVSMVIEVLEILSLAARGTWRLGFWRPSPRRGL